GERDAISGAGGRVGGRRMRRTELVFERPERVFAHEPPEVRGRARGDVRLLVTRPDGHHHARFEDLPRFLRAGDLLVVNESAAIPASLPAEGSLGPILLNLCTRFRSDLWIAEPRWSAGKPGPLPIEPDEELRIGSATARLLAPYPGIPRLWFALADRRLEPRDRDGYRRGAGDVPGTFRHLSRHRRRGEPHAHERGPSDRGRDHGR